MKQIAIGCTNTYKRSKTMPDKHRSYLSVLMTGDSLSLVMSSKVVMCYRDGMTRPYVIQ